MDYAFVNAINYIPLIVMILMLYDIMCQYWIHFIERIRDCGNHLTLPPGMIFNRGIGLFHVHGHIKQCYPRYAPTFIQGAGRVDGEVIETLWSTLNHTAKSARPMSWFHRQEFLDAHMADSNWKKLTGMGSCFSSSDNAFVLMVRSLLPSTQMESLQSQGHRDRRILPADVYQCWRGEDPEL
jgi:hypothetical protein